VSDIRATYLRFPGWTQHFWTWQTGKALPGQEPLIRHTWASYLAVTLGVFLGGLAISATATAAMFPLWYLVVLLGWFPTVTGARMLVLVIAHQALHRRFSGNQGVDRFWGEAATVLTFSATFQEFKEKHFDNHHRREVFATEADPPVQVLIGLGFRPGLSRAALWRRSWFVFFSPAFYARNFADRFVSNISSGSWRRLAFAVWIAWWVSLPFWMPHGLLVLILAFILPVILFAELSELLDKLGEHEWLAPRIPEYGHRFYTAANTAARFCGSPVPAQSMPFGPQCKAWVRWVTLTTFYHLPARLLVIAGDLPNHDYHHRYPSTSEWTTAAYARQRDIDLGPQGPPYKEVWGMGNAIDRLFRSLEQREVPADARAYS
jgi:hypothetical protein